MPRKLLLINPAHIVDGRPRPGPMQFPIPPVSLGYVAALTPPGWTVRIHDENLKSIDALSDWAPNLVGVTTLTPTAPRAYALADRYRARGATVVLGGMHATILPEEALAHADSVVIGEAEPVWSRLIADFEQGQLRPSYRGELADLDGLPLPRRDLLSRRYFVETLITSKGCTNACDFCAIWRVYGRRYRPRPVGAVAEEVARLPTSKFVFFADDNLALDRRRTAELCRLLVASKGRRRYAIQAGLGVADDPELLHWLKRSGCVFIFVGLESLNDAALIRIGKPDLVRTGRGGYRERIDRIHAHGIAVYGSFIVGLDGDTPVVFDQIREFVLSAGIDCALINILSPTPGTLLWDRLRSQGRLLYVNFPADYALYVQDNVCFRPEGMTPEALQEGTRQLLADLNRPAVAFRRAVATWRHTRNPLATLTALGWNWRTFRSLSGFPPRDVRELFGRDLCPSWRGTV
jgi:radical SAM superfamily enzyme YgiQ (UPF0313 family)